MRTCTSSQSSRKYIAVLLAAAVMLSMVAACASPTDTSTEDAATTATGTLQGEPSTSQHTTTTPAPSAEASSGQDSYTGTDPQEILSKLCATSGCHDMATLQAWSGDSVTVQATIDSMVSISGITEEQTDALVQYYNAKAPQ